MLCTAKHQGSHQVATIKKGYITHMENITHEILENKYNFLKSTLKNAFHECNMEAKKLQGPEAQGQFRTAQCH